MNVRFLLGIHETNSPTTQHLLRIVSEFLELFSQHLSLFLLTVISVPYVASPTL